MWYNYHRNQTAVLQSVLKCCVPKNSWKWGSQMVYSKTDHIIWLNDANGVSALLSYACYNSVLAFILLYLNVK